jgi:hypothetical protein
VLRQLSAEELVQRDARLAGGDVPERDLDSGLRRWITTWPSLGAPASAAGLRQLVAHDVGLRPTKDCPSSPRSSSASAVDALSPSPTTPSSVVTRTIVRLIPERSRSP